MQGSCGSVMACGASKSNLASRALLVTDFTAVEAMREALANLKVDVDTIEAEFLNIQEEKKKEANRLKRVEDEMKLAEAKRLQEEAEANKTFLRVVTNSTTRLCW